MMFKSGFLIVISFVLLIILSLIPLGCDEEDTGNESKATAVTKAGYIYAPVKPVNGSGGLATGLIALEQDAPPEGYQIVKNAVVSIGNTRVKSDEKGKFSITGLNPGEHQMLICASGFQPVVQLTAVAAASSSTVAIDTLKVIPEKAFVTKGDIMPFMAVGKDPVGNFVPLAAVNWSVINTDKQEKRELGKVTNTGLLNADEIGIIRVVAASSTYSANTEVTILDPANANTSTLTGKVTLPSGSAVEGGQIIVLGTRLMSVTDADGKYSLLDVPSEQPLTLFVIKNDVIIGSAPVQLEKWKEKSLDIMATSNPPPVEEDPNAVPAEDVSSVPVTTGSLIGYVYVPSGKEKSRNDLSKLAVMQSKNIPEGYMALSGAKVMVENDPTISSVTASDGGFSLNGIPYKGEGGPYFVVVSADGFSPVRAPLLFTGDYPLGAVSKMEIYPENPVIGVGAVIEFKAICYDRKGKIIETPKLDWAYEGDRGEINPVDGFFISSKIGNGTVKANYGDISAQKEFKIINKDETGSLSGIITDENSKPVSDAFVIVENCPWVGITDENGKYNISSVPTGEKITVYVKVKGKNCGESFASVGRGAEGTEDISIVLPKEEEPEKTVDTSIPDMPPVSINPETPASLTPGTVSNHTIKTPAPDPTPREEYPRWPGADNSTGNNDDTHGHADRNRSHESFPRWPDSTKSE
ncbi:MAG: carboxypeptidase-like regulatory domain-containing protein [Candidatus Eremiobacterota bacterium]